MNIPEPGEVDREDLKQSLLDNWSFIAVAGVFLLALYLRYLPEQGMAFLQALDPYMIFRMSQHLALEGNFPPLDFARYFPYSTPRAVLQQGNIAIPAVMYWLGPFLFFNSYLEWAQFYPAFAGAIGVLFTYFLGKEIFDRETGFYAAFFTATITGIMHRTSAGFFEKEPTGTMFMMISLFFFSRGWKREDWISGMLSGVALGLFTISWGGSSMLWLLYPMVVGLMLWINDDIRKLVATYTPVVAIGGFIGFTNPSVFWLTDSLFLVNFGMLGFLWSRYLVEKFNVIEDDLLNYYTPTLSLLGLVTLGLSPLYSDFLARKFMAVIGKVSQGGGGVVAGTVAENQAASMGQLASQLGAVSASRLARPLTGIAADVAANFAGALTLVANVSGAWALANLGIPILAASLFAMVGRKFDLFEKEISGERNLAVIQSFLISWFLLIIGTFLVLEGIIGLSLIHIFLSAGVALVSLLALSIYLEDEDAFSIVSIGFIFTIIGATIVGLGQSSSVLQALLSSPFALAFLYPLWAAGVGIGVIAYREEFSAKTIEFNWYYLLPVAWAVTNILAAVTKSRLIFLASFSAAFMAGYGFSRAVKRLRNFSAETASFTGLVIAVLFIDLGAILILGRMAGVALAFSIVVLVNASAVYAVREYGPFLKEDYDYSTIRNGVIASILFLVLVVNASSGFVTANQMGGSPNSAWMDNLEYLEEETPEGSSILSWWDYGYWFESIGRRPAVADGGNYGYYSSTGKINFPLAEFLTSSKPENHTDFLEKHSVDYIVLDETMIGKYSAVSQIANRDNQNFNSMLQLSSANNIRNSMVENNNQTLVQFSDRRSGLTTYAPIQVAQSEVSISGPPVVESRGGSRGQIGCVLTENGVKDFNVSQEMSLGAFGEMCAAVNPYYSLERALTTSNVQQARSSPARLVLVPKKIMDSTLVRLYLMDGHGIDFVEKVPDGSNGYVRMWKVEGVSN